jgi:ABC-type glutathione transport system ATPase component
MESISEQYGVDQAATGSDRSEPVVSVRGLVKRYGSREAVAGIDLEVRRGEIFAFLGPNGAGKTTTVEILAGFRQRTKGQVSVLGQDPATAGGSWRDRVGVVLQESQPEPGLSVRECLAMYAGFYHAPRDIDQTIALVGLTENAGDRQRRRLSLLEPARLYRPGPSAGTGRIRGESIGRCGDRRVTRPCPSRPHPCRTRPGEQRERRLLA